MNSMLNKIIDKLFIKNWIIGITKFDKETVIKNGKIPTDFSWIINPDLNKFYADPFIYKADDGSLYLFCEELNRENFVGNIICLKLDSDFNIVNKAILLQNEFHFSYPFLIRYKSKLYIIPENSTSNKLVAYEFDEVNFSL